MVRRKLVASQRKNVFPCDYLSPGNAPAGCAEFDASGARSPFPAVDKREGMVGIGSEKDLLDASPSDAASLSIFEVNYLLSKIAVKRIMAQNVITITEDTPLEGAARIMADNKIGELPILRDGNLLES